MKLLTLKDILILKMQHDIRDMTIVQVKIKMRLMKTSMLTKKRK